MFPGINAKYGILKDDGKLEELMPLKELKCLDEVPEVESYYPMDFVPEDVAIDISNDVDFTAIQRALYSDSENQRKIYANIIFDKAYCEIMDEQGRIFKTRFINKYIKPKHRVKKGKKYIWKYKNSKWCWLEGIYKRGEWKV